MMPSPVIEVPALAKITRSDIGPHASRDGGVHRLGKLQNHNQPASPEIMLASPRCLAITRSGRPCRAPGVRDRRTRRYGRCRMHGGSSTGPRTPEGLERARMANWRHGGRSREVVERRRTVAALRRCNVRLLKLVKRLERPRRQPTNKTKASRIGVGILHIISGDEPAPLAAGDVGESG